MSKILQTLIGRGEPHMTLLALNERDTIPSNGAGTADAEGEIPSLCGSEERRPSDSSDRPVIVPSRPPDLRPRLRPVPLHRVSPLLASDEGLAYASEQYRILRTRILQLQRKPFQLVITSPSVGDGKTLTAVNLAAALALRSEDPTLLIDADLRRAGIHRMLQIPNEPGLADILRGSCRLDEAIFAVDTLPGLHVLPAGEPRGNPAELLDSEPWRDLAEIVRQRFAHTIVDCPPVEVVADYDLIAAVCNSAILVLRPDHTDRTLSLRAIEKLKPKLTGVIINAAPEWFLWKRPAHHGYYYYRQEAKNRERA
jgi:protein-tyrosine kinase